MVTKNNISKLKSVPVSRRNNWLFQQTKTHHLHLVKDKNTCLLKNILRVFDIFRRVQTCQDVLSEQQVNDEKRNLIELLLDNRLNKKKKIPYNYSSESK